MTGHPSNDQEVLEAYIQATTAAIRVLVRCLEDTCALPKGEFALRLLDHMKADRNEGSTLKLALLDRLRMTMLN
jgi:hypothetical protein